MGVEGGVTLRSGKAKKQGGKQKCFGQHVDLVALSGSSYFVYGGRWQQLVDRSFEMKLSGRMIAVDASEWKENKWKKGRK